MIHTCRASELLDAIRVKNLLLRRILKGVLFAGVTVLTLGSTLGCSDSLQESSAWYNKPWLRSIFGDFKETEDLAIPEGPERAKLVERGAYLTEHVAACGACHGTKAGDPQAPLSGGRLMRDRFGIVQAANITPDTETGIGDWNVFEVMRAVKAGIDREGRPISVDLHQGYRWMADRDVKAIAVYLLSLKPNKNEVPRRRLGGFERNRWGIFPQHSEVTGYVPALSEDTSPVRGRYLAQYTAQCAMCHSSGAGEFKGYQQEGGILSLFRAVKSAILGDGGGEEYSASVAEYLTPEGRKAYEAELLAKQGSGASDMPGRVTEIYASALQSGEYPVGGPDIRGGGGLSEWSEEDIVRYLGSGTTPKGEVREGRFCPWPFFQGMSYGDKRSIAQYLKKLS